MPVELRECVQMAEARVDRAAGVIANCKVLGWKSANGREYLPSGVSASLYEGRAVNADHVKAGGSRSVRDTVGFLEAVEVRPDGVYAGRLRLLNPDGDFERRLLAAAETNPRLFGLSHTARGRERPGSGGTVIEAVESVQSVDIVNEPATVAGLFEGKTVAEKLTLKALQESLKAKRPGYARALAEMAQSGVMGADAMMPAPEGEPPADAGADHEQAIRDACKACIDDQSLDAKAALDKIKKLLGMLGGDDKAAPPPPADDEPADDDGEGEAMESLKAEIQALKSRETLREAADAAGVKVPKALLESLRPDVTEAQAKALVAELKGVQPQRPGARSAPPPPPADKGKAVTESKAARPTAADLAEIAKRVNGRN